MPEQHPIVEVVDLVKVYPGGTQALAGVTFSVAKGEFFGFLGPNGAGKTTAMKILATLLRKTSGRVYVAGYDVDRDPMAIRRSIGFALQEVGVDDLSTGREFLVLQGQLYHLSKGEAVRRADELLDLVGLAEVAGRLVGTYSGGMRRRLDLAGALMHRPPLLFLDEPTTGLDPQSRLALWDYLRKLNGEGVTIFLTTQMMEEADRLCQRIAIIDGGTLVAEGTPASLKGEIGADVLTITLEGDGSVAREEVRTLLSSLPFVIDVRDIEDGAAVYARDGGAAVPDVIKVLNDAGIQVASLTVASPTLDDVFLKYTGHQIRSEAGTRSAFEQTMRLWRSR